MINRQLRPGALRRTMLVAGSLAATVEMAPVLAIQSGALGVSPARVFQAIASGLLGAAAYRGGATAIMLGVALHWLISAGAALVFSGTALGWPDLLRRPVLAGLGFGVIAYAVMTALVVPFSAAAFPPNTARTLMLVSLGVHMIFFGLPIALATRWQFRRAGRET